MVKLVNCLKHTVKCGKLVMYVLNTHLSVVKLVKCLKHTVKCDKLVKCLNHTGKCAKLVKCHS